MFSSTGLFKHVTCPNQDNCLLISCIFSHESSVIEYNDTKASGAVEYDPFSAGDAMSPPSKKRKLEASQDESIFQTGIDLHSSSNGIEAEVKEKSSRTVTLAKSFVPVPQQAQLEAETSPAFTRRPRDSESDSRVKNVPKSITRPVSPPPLTESKRFTKDRNIQATKPEQLTPRMVARAPAVHKTRLTILQAIHQQMIVKNKKVESGSVEWKDIHLTDHELVRLALDEEQEAATKLDEGIYRNAMAQKIQKLKKMTQEDWKDFVREKYARTCKVEIEGKQTKDAARDPISTGLASINEEIAILERLRTPLEGLEKHGYVTQKPSDEAVSEMGSVLEATAGFETCERCGTRFQVFLGRDAQGRLTTAGTCRYHWARLGRGQWRDGFTGPSEPTFGCCNASLGSLGCTESDTHVFKISDPVRLATILQFEHTPATNEKRRSCPVAFDCEMAYTTLGMEVIRVTAVSWPQRELLLDILVRPFGEVLDLNTRFSGVTKEQFAAALPCETVVPEISSKHSTQEQGLAQSDRLYKVESPRAARQLLFRLLSPETPLIGHAIENDLNTCRIIHPFVIDTVLLYPHPKGLPVRFSLKILAQKYLNRGIQLGGPSGHDSKEDAIATADLVATKVAEKWKIMKHEGWTFEDGVLVALREEKKFAVGSKAAL